MKDKKKEWSGGQPYKRNPHWNVDLRYGRYGMKWERPRDLVDDIKAGLGFKLVKGFNLINANQFE